MGNKASSAGRKQVELGEELKGLQATEELTMEQQHEEQEHEQQQGGEESEAIELGLGGKAAEAAAAAATTTTTGRQQEEHQEQKPRSRSSFLHDMSESALYEDDTVLKHKTPSQRSRLQKALSLGVFENEPKWRKNNSVIGALEVHSTPYLDVHAQLRPKVKQGREDAFRRAMDAWEKFHVRQSFVNFANNIPVATKCFGLIRDDDKTIRNLCNILNSKWRDVQNQKLEDLGFELDLYVWSWSNVGGKATTNILLIRFFELE